MIRTNCSGPNTINHGDMQACARYWTWFVSGSSPTYGGLDVATNHQERAYTRCGSDFQSDTAGQNSRQPETLNDTHSADPSPRAAGRQ